MSALGFLLQLCAALGVGMFALQCVDRRDVLAAELGRCLMLLVAAGVGAGILSTMFFVAAAFGLAPREVVVGIMILSAMLLTREGDTFRGLVRTLRVVKGPGEIVGALCFAGASAVIAFLAWSPADMIDTWMYHISVPQQWLLHGRIVAFPYDMHSNLHLLGSMWYTGGLALDPRDLILPKLTSVACGVGIGLVLALEVGRRLSVAIGLMVGAMWLLTTEMWEYATSAYIDVPSGFLLVLAFAVLMRAANASAPSRAVLLLVAGALLGIGTAVKMSGYVFSPLMILTWAFVLGWSESASGRWHLAQQVLLAGVAALLFVGPWWVRAWWTTGAPLFPYFLDWFPVGVEHARVGREFRPDFGNFGFFGGTVVAHPSAAVGSLLLYVRNFAYIDQNAVVLSAILIRLTTIVIQRRRSMRTNRATVWADVFSAFALFFLLTGAPRRFLIGLSAILLIHALTQMADLLAPRFHRSRWRGFLTAVVIGTMVLFGIMRGMGYVGRTLPSREAMPIRWYFTSGEMRAAALPTLAGGELLTILEEHPPQGRVLMTELLPLTVHLNTLLLLNGPMHSANTMRLVVEEEGADARGLAEWLSRQGVSHILTAEPFDTPVLQEFRDEYLLQVGEDRSLRLYQLQSSVQ